jgi:hypothetical protein
MILSDSGAIFLRMTQNEDLLVIPDEAMMAGPFTLLRFAGRSLPDVVYAERLTSADYLDKPAELEVYGKRLNRLSVAAHPPGATEKLFTELLDAF